jgi:hypothetical protein
VHRTVDVAVAQAVGVEASAIFALEEPNAGQATAFIFVVFQRAVRDPITNPVHRDAVRLETFVLARADRPSAVDQMPTIPAILHASIFVNVETAAFCVAIATRVLWVALAMPLWTSIRGRGPKGWFIGAVDAVWNQIVVH